MSTDTSAATASAAPTPSPLAEASAESLEILLSRDPWTLSEDDMLRGIEALRAQRRNWIVDEAAGAKRAKAPAKVKGTAKTSLADLGLLDD